MSLPTKNEENEVEATLLHRVRCATNDVEEAPQSPSINKAPRRDTLFLYLAVILANLSVLMTGSSIVWLSPVVPILRSNNTEVNPLGKPATTENISMLASLPVIFNFIAGLILPRLADFTGRKLYLQVMGLFTMISVVFLAFSTSVTSIIAFRCVCVLLCNTAISLVPIYVTEICDDHNRAKFGCFFGIFLQIGHMSIFSIGPYLSYRDVTLLATAPIVPFLIFFFYAPETPIYLLSRGKNAESIAALRKLRANKTQQEIDEDFEKLNQTLKLRQVKNKPSWLAFVKTKEIRIGLLLAMMPVVVQYMSGITVIMSFLAPFFDSAGTSFSGNNLGIIIGCVKIATSTFTSFVVEKIGRKRMLLVSTLGTGIPLFLLGCFFYLKHANSSSIAYLQWLPITCVLSNVFMYALGLGPIPMGIMHEMFPSEYRAMFIIILSAVLGIISFAFGAAYPIVEASIGVHWLLFIFSFSCFVGFTLMYFFLPETKGKTLAEIQEILKNY